MDLHMFRTGVKGAHIWNSLNWNILLSNMLYCDNDFLFTFKTSVRSYINLYCPKFCNSEGILDLYSFWQTIKYFLISLIEKNIISMDVYNDVTLHKLNQKSIWIDRQIIVTFLNTCCVTQIKYKLNTELTLIYR